MVSFGRPGRSSSPARVKGREHVTPPPQYRYAGQSGGDTFDATSLEQQTRAVRQVGGAVVRYTGRTLAELVEALEGVDVVMLQGHRFDAAAFTHMGEHGRCKGLVSFGHGYDQLDLDAAVKHGVVLANTASFGTEEVSNHTMMHFLVCARKFVLHDKLVRQGVWSRAHLAPMGHIAGQTFGVIGLGNIGRAVARKARAFGLQVIGHDPYVAAWDATEYGVEQVATVDELCRRADYVTLHCYLADGTRHIIGRRQFDLMKPTAYVINCARGGVVDEQALIEALTAKRILSAVGSRECPRARRGARSRPRRAGRGAGRPRPTPAPSEATSGARSAPRPAAPAPRAGPADLRTPPRPADGSGSAGPRVLDRARPTAACRPTRRGWSGPARGLPPPPPATGGSPPPPRTPAPAGRPPARAARRRGAAGRRPPWSRPRLAAPRGRRRRPSPRGWRRRAP